MKDNNIHKERHLRYAAELILAYNGDEPFHLYLKRYFREHKNMVQEIEGILLRSVIIISD